MNGWGNRGVDHVDGWMDRLRGRERRRGGERRDDWWGGGGGWND